MALETFVPWKLIKRGVRREVITPLGAPEQFKVEAAEEINRGSALVKALGLAFHWQRLLDMGKVKSINEIAEREDISKQRVSLILKTLQLSPQVIKSVLTGDAKVTLDYLKKHPLPLLWEEQRILLEDSA